MNNLKSLASIQDLEQYYRELRARLIVQRMQSLMSSAIVYNRLGNIDDYQSHVKTFLDHEARSNGPGQLWLLLMDGAPGWFKTDGVEWSPEGMKDLVCTCLAPARQDSLVLALVAKTYEPQVQMYDFGIDRIVSMSKEVASRDDFTCTTRLTGQFGHQFVAKILSDDDMRRYLLYAWQNEDDVSRYRAARKALIQLFWRAWDAHLEQVTRRIGSHTFIFEGPDGAVFGQEPEVLYFVDSGVPCPRWSSNDVAWYATKDGIENANRLLTWLQDRLPKTFSFPLASELKRGFFTTRWKQRGFWNDTKYTLEEWIVVGMRELDLDQAILCQGKLVVTRHEYERRTR